MRRPPIYTNLVGLSPLELSCAPTCLFFRKPNSALEQHVVVHLASIQVALCTQWSPLLCNHNPGVWARSMLFWGVFLCSPVFLCFLFFVQPLFVLNNIVRLPLFDKLFDPFSLELTFDHCRPSSMSVTPSTCATHFKHRRMRSHSGP